MSPLVLSDKPLPPDEIQSMPPDPPWDADRLLHAELAALRERVTALEEDVQVLRDLVAGELEPGAREATLAGWRMDARGRRRRGT